MNLTIKQIVDETGISADTLRYYDRLGIVSPIRHENGYRYYSDKNLSDLQYVTVMKYANFSLTKIKAMVDMFGQDPSPECNKICREILNSKLMELKQLVINYQKIVNLMEELLPMVGSINAYCESQSTHG